VKTHVLFVSYNTNTRNKKIYHCFYCGAGIYFDENVRSEKTNKHLPLNLEDATKHECAAEII
jgi:hypothetical protein